jgi:hypothetical protein
MVAPTISASDGAAGTGLASWLPADAPASGRALLPGSANHLRARSVIAGSDGLLNVTRGNVTRGNVTRGNARRARPEAAGAARNSRPTEPTVERAAMLNCRDTRREPDATATTWCRRPNQSSAASTTRANPAKTPMSR